MFPRAFWFRCCCVSSCFLVWVLCFHMDNFLLRTTISFLNSLQTMLTNKIVTILMLN